MECLCADVDECPSALAIPCESKCDLCPCNDYQTSFEAWSQRSASCGGGICGRSASCLASGRIPGEAAMCGSLSCPNALADTCAKASCQRATPCAIVLPSTLLSCTIQKVNTPNLTKQITRAPLHHVASAVTARGTCIGSNAALDCAKRLEYTTTSAATIANPDPPHFLSS